MKTHVTIPSIVFLFFSIALCKTVLAYETGYDYPGGDLITHYSNVGTANQCANLCKNNPACAVFTWVKPGIQGTTGFCWLKSSLSKKVANSCCTSGIIRPVRPDYCKWHQVGTSYSCHCQSSKTKKWYQTNPSACPQPKPSPKYINRQKDNCPPGQIWQSSPGVFGQGRGGQCILK